MPVASVTEQEFEQQVLRSQLPVLVDLYADWCQPCKQLEPILNQLADELNGKLKIVRVDVERSPMLARAFRVQSIPMMVLIHGGRPVDQVVGLVDKKTILAMLQPVLPQEPTAPDEVPPPDLALLLQQGRAQPVDVRETSRSTATASPERSTSRPRSCPRVRKSCGRAMGACACCTAAAATKARTWPRSCARAAWSSRTSRAASCTGRPRASRWSAAGDHAPAAVAKAAAARPGAGWLRAGIRGAARDVAAPAGVHRKRRAAQDAALRFALALAQELRARGCAAAGLADAGVRAKRRSPRRASRPRSSLPHADADAVAALRGALEALPQDTLVLGVGREPQRALHRSAQRGDRSGAGEADLWLPAPSAAVASAIGAWVADHLCSAAMHS